MDTKRFVCYLGLLVFTLSAEAIPFWGARDSSAIETAAQSLKAGQWIWSDKAPEEGPMVIIVSLTEQRAYVYRNGILIGITTISSGRAGYQTPTGIFTILQKSKDHRSNLYNNAPMPYALRLTWSGVMLHAGGLPGYPESHGCVHLPTEFAKKLFATTSLGMTVVVSEKGRMDLSLVHPGPLSPIDPHTGNQLKISGINQSDAWHWEPWKMETGPVSVILSQADQQMLVYRNGIEIGRSKIEFPHPASKATPTRAYIVANGYTPPPAGTDVSQMTLPQWIAIGVPGQSSAQQAADDVSLADQAIIPDDFKARLLPLMVPGTVVVITPDSLVNMSAESTIPILDTDNQLMPTLSNLSLR